MCYIEHIWTVSCIVFFKIYFHALKKSSSFLDWLVFFKVRVVGLHSVLDYSEPQV